MMYWYGDHMSGWGYTAMTVGTLLFWTLLVVIAVAAFRRLGGGPPAGFRDADTPPEATLAQRFARGDIDEEEYRRRLDVLRATAAHPSR